MKAGTIAKISPIDTSSRSVGLVIAVSASCSLAYVIPYDVNFDRLTMGSPSARALAMLCMWISGIWLARANKFSLPIVGLRRPTLTIGAAALGVALWCIFLDAVLFVSISPPRYRLWEHEPLPIRLIYYGSRAFNENVIYRLFLGSLASWLLCSLFRKRSLALVMVGMLVAQLINVAPNFSATVSLNYVAWQFLRFVLPAMVWAWLYVRHGFAANEGAAIGVHGFLQPMVSVVFH